MAGSEDDPALELLRNFDWPSREVAHLFVDISSMSRVWYAAVINWARSSIAPSEVILDFGYSIGTYEGDYPHRVVSSIKAIPGCEGYPDPRAEVLAIFGLGLDGISPLAVLDDLEPDDVLGFAAIERGKTEISDLTRRVNSGLLDLCRECVVFSGMECATHVYRTFRDNQPLRRN